MDISHYRRKIGELPGSFGAAQSSVIHQIGLTITHLSHSQAQTILIPPEIAKSDPGTSVIFKLVELVIRMTELKKHCYHIVNIFFTNKVDAGVVIINSSIDQVFYFR